MPRFEREQSEYIEKVVYLNRVSKTVKGGRVMKFSALVVDPIRAQWASLLTDEQPELKV